MWTVHSLILVTGIALGFGAASFIKPLSADDGFRARYESLIAKLEQIHHIDTEEYLALREQKAKFEKADEILGKMMLIFLADLGFKASSEKHKLAVRMANGQGRTDSAGAPPAVPAAPAEASAALAAGEGLKPTASGEQNGAREFITREKELDEVRNEAQAKEFLDKVAVDELFPELKTATRMRPEQFREVNGTFSGKIIFADSTKPIWDIEMTLDGVFRDDAIPGSIDIKMFKPGETKPFSHSRGKGDDVKNYQSFSGDSQAILINVYGDDGYLQVYAPKALGHLIANYYDKQGVASYKKSGTAVLLRR